MASGGEQTMAKPKTPPADFAEQAEEKSIGIVSEFIDFLKYNKKWWIAPIIILLLLFGLLIMLGGSALAPFIYPLILRSRASGSDMWR